MNRILKEEVLDISFEEELIKEFEEIFGEALHKADERNLKDDNENLKKLARILMRLAECIDQIKKEKEEGHIPFIHFELYSCALVTVSITGSQKKVTIYIGMLLYMIKCHIPVRRNVGDFR